MSQGARKPVPVEEPEAEETKAHSYWDEKKVYDIARDDTLTYAPEPGGSIMRAIDEGLRISEGGNEAHGRFSIHPTDITHCLRKTVLQRHFGRKPMSPTGKILAGLGNKAHGILQDAMVLAGLEIKNEVRFEDKSILATMRMDGVAYWAESTGKKGVQYVLEIKSVAGWGYRNIVKSGLPRASDVIQLQYYLQVVKAKQGVLLYVSRDNGDIFTITLKADPILQDYIMQRFAVVLEADKTHTVMERPYIRSHWACKADYCEMAQLCGAIPDEGGVMNCQ